ncbi:hypothetical protein AWB69_05707 [Caballeronia udeis]|uniref:Uncharacterized protein n=1 Tax=Caballeronia udeis TaxID=1232866 RepID=A0A158IBK2_9BURK|nr:hypothetical protein [Caballeronia udeis]SAL53936.1 hypothetical protein AWB69_05707 [Caballeronia udeis]
MGESNSTELLPGDFITTDVYHNTFDDLYEKLLDEAAYLYHRSKKEGWQIQDHDVEDYRRVLGVINEFRQTIVIPLMATAELDPYAMQGSVSNARTKALLDYVRTSIAWAVTGQKSWEAGNQHKAWGCMCRAQYWLGRANQVARLPTAVKRDASKRAQAGATKRDAKFEPLRTLARHLAARRRFPSKRNAALSIKPEILAAAKEQNINLSEMQAERTITGWLDGMSFGSKQ